MVTVSDLAETTDWLRMQSAALRRSPKQARLIEDACVTHGVEFYRGMLQAWCRPGEELAQVVTRVGQGGASGVRPVVHLPRAGGRVHYGRSGRFPDRAGVRIRARREAGRPVGTRLDDRFPRSQQASQFPGQVLSTGIVRRRTGSPRHVLAAWHDLNHLATGPEALTFVLAVRRYRRRLDERGFQADRIVVHGVTLVPTGRIRRRPERNGMTTTATCPPAPPSSGGPAAARWRRRSTTSPMWTDWHRSSRTASSGATRSYGSACVRARASA